MVSILLNDFGTYANVTPVAIVFAPTLNIPAPLIQLFLTDYPAIFGEPIDEKQSPIQELTLTIPPQGDGIRSPRHQMFSDLPTPAYTQTGFGQAMPGFQPLPPNPHANRNTYAPPRQHENNGYMGPPIYNLQPPPGSEGFGSLNAMSHPVSKKGRRESSMMGLGVGLVNQRQTSRQTLRDTSSSSQISEQAQMYEQHDRDTTPERQKAAPVTLF